MNLALRAGPFAQPVHLSSDLRRMPAWQSFCFHQSGKAHTSHGLYRQDASPARQHVANPDSAPGF